MSKLRKPNSLLFITLVIIGLTYSIQANELHQAIIDTQKDKVIELIESGIDVWEVNEKGEGSIHLAVKTGNRDIVRTLLTLPKARIINQRDNLKNTPLHLASERGDLAIVSLLLSKGAYFRAHNLEDKTPLILANENGSKEVIAELKSWYNKSETPPSHLLKYNTELATGWYRNIQTAEAYRENSEKITKGRSALSMELSDLELEESLQWLKFSRIYQGFNQIMQSVAAIISTSENFTPEGQTKVQELLLKGQKYLDQEKPNSIPRIVEDIKWELEKAGFEL